MARVAYQLALTNAHIRADIVEVSEFPQLAQRYQVRAVPTTVIDDKVKFPGAVPAKVLVEIILKAVQGGLSVGAEPSGETTPTSQPGQERTTLGGIILP